MNRIWICLFCLVSAISLAQQQKPASPAKVLDLMMVDVSTRDARSRTVYVGPIAWLSTSGEWKKIACDNDHPDECRKFNRDYLKKPHTYTVVSADGRGASVQVERMDLTPNDDPDECFGYGGDGTYSGASIREAAVAASSTEFFTTGAPARRLTEPDAEPIRKAFAVAVGDKLDSIKELRIYTMRFEGRDMFAVQRAYQDYASKPEFDSHLESIFAIGTMMQGTFHLLHWKEISDDNERVLGIIHLKSGKDFLVNTVSDPETDYYRIYGIRNGKLEMIFEGGGGGC
jgi:hypothetical protein